MALADITDVTPETSSDEIKDLVDKLVDEVEQDRKGEVAKKSDAQITDEHADLQQPGSKSKDTPAETNSGRDSAEEGEETGDNSDIPEWITDEVRAEAEAFGIDESELADFASREELDRALRLFDKRALEAGRKGLAESDTPSRNEKGQFVKKEEQKADHSKEQSPRDGRYQVSLNPDLYDDEIIAEFSKMRDHYESRLEALEAHFADASAKAEEQHFDNEIDKLGMVKIFGITGKETAEEIRRRDDVMAQAKVLQAGYRNFGRDIPIEALVKRSAQIVFPLDFEKQLLKDRTKKISRQSNGRMGGSPTKPQPPREDPRDEADRLYREMQNK